MRGLQSIPIQQSVFEVSHMEVDQLISRFPRLYHMAQRDSWDNIQKMGLLSTSALLDHLDIQGVERFTIESQWRPHSVSIGNGKVVIRDQGPIRPADLEVVLEGMSVQEWYELLNRKTFFWLTRERLQKLLDGRRYQRSEHVVIIVDTQALVEGYLDKITLSPINSGSAFNRMGKRGPYTFKAIQDYPMARSKDAPAELAVDWSIPDIADLALRVEVWQGSSVVTTIWER